MPAFGNKIIERWKASNGHKCQETTNICNTPCSPLVQNHTKLELGHKTMTQDELKIVTWAQPTKPTQDFDFLCYKHFWEPFQAFGYSINKDMTKKTN